MHLKKFSVCKKIVLLVSCIFVVSMTYADDSLNTRKVTMSGSMNYQVLQLVKSGGNYAKVSIWGNEKQMDKAWRHIIAGEVKISIDPQDNLGFNFGYRTAITSTQQFDGSKQDFGNNIPRSSGLSVCDVVLDFSNNSVFPGILTGGIFPFKYNPDAKDLGEYLITSGCYPGYVFSGREWNNIAGLHLQSDIVKNFHQDLLITSEMANKPFFDISLTYIGTLSAGKIAKIGAGIMFNRLISMQEDLTTPSPETVNGKDVTFTHRGIKIMSRFSLDTKQLLGASEILGAEDLKLYGEAAILGVKDYPFYYDNLAERIPVMFGINLPAFKLLDYCAIEGEWYGSPHSNNPPQGVSYAAVPKDADLGHGDDVKWSISFKRSVNTRFALFGRVANDHLRFEDASGGFREWSGLAADVWERTTKRQHWYWSMNALISF